MSRKEFHVLRKTLLRRLRFPSMGAFWSRSRIPKHMNTCTFMHICIPSAHTLHDRAQSSRSDSGPTAAWAWDRAQTRPGVATEGLGSCKVYACGIYRCMSVYMTLYTPVCCNCCLFVAICRYLLLYVVFVWFCCCCCCCFVICRYLLLVTVLICYNVVLFVAIYNYY
jgi:hypothetical protein